MTKENKMGFLLESMRVSLSDALNVLNGQCPNLGEARDNIRIAQSALGKATIHAHRAGALDPDEPDTIKCIFERGGTHEEIELDASTVNGIVAGFDTAENVDGPSPSANWRRLCAALARISREDDTAPDGECEYVPQVKVEIEIDPRAVVAEALFARAARDLRELANMLDRRGRRVTSDDIANCAWVDERTLKVNYDLRDPRDECW